jgi:hypothetical protein
VIVLEGVDLIVRIDPLHGGEILDLVHREAGRQLLGRPPFAATDRIAGNLDEETWIAAYRGGWQLLTPNAGNSCSVDGDFHGFHGQASNDPWSVVEVKRASATLRWRGHGLEVTRELEIVGDALELHTTFEAVSDRTPFVTVEHFTVGLDLLDPAVEIRLPGGDAYELSEAFGPPCKPDKVTQWPMATLLDASTERSDRWDLADVHGRLLVVADVPEGRADIVNLGTGTGLSLEWDHAILPHLWIWHEARFSDGPWRGQAEMLAIEPASVPHSLGLATAIQNDQAHWVDPGLPIIQHVTARPVIGVGALTPS